ncbi:MAG: DinB family protein [Phycisphaerales bacterium]
MTRILLDAILRTWDKQRDYAHRLTADLSDADLVSQPVPGVVMNHPAWVFSHIGLYPPVLTKILRAEPFDDPARSPYGKESRPSSRTADYPPKQALLGAYFRDHDLLARTLEATDQQFLAQPVPLERWKPRFPYIADLVVHLMIDHEMGHLGQVSAWRRAGGRPSV